MASLDRLPLFTEARERLGRSFASALERGLPEVAERLERAAESERAPLERRDLFAAAAILRIEATARAQGALAALHDLSFRLLQIGIDGAPDMPPDLLPDPELEARILADELAQAVRERLGERYEGWRRRIDALVQDAPAEPRAPLGATAIAHAAVHALRPMAIDRASREVLRDAALERLVPPLAAAILTADTWLDAQGIEHWHSGHPETRPPHDDPVVPASPSPAVQIASAGTVAREPAPGPASNAASFDAPHGGGDASTGPADTASQTDASHTPQPPADALAPAMPVPEGASGEAVGTTPATPCADGTPASAPPGAAPGGAPAAGPPGAAPGGAPAGAPPSAAPLSGTASATADTGSGASAAGADAAMTRAAEALVHDTELADLLGRHPMAARAPPESAHRHAGALARPSALERDAVAFAHHVGVAPYTREARRQFFAALRFRMLEANANPAQLATLDLVGAMFDYTIDDARMPEAAKPLLWRLQHPAVTLVALDAGFLGDDRRSLRRLVEHVAAISLAYADDVVPGSELHRRLDTVVRAVEVVSHAFQSRSSVLGEQVRREYDRAQQGVAQLVSRVEKDRRALEATPARRNRRDFTRRPSTAREQDVTQRLHARLDERLRGRDVPESVRDFLHGAWLRQLRTAVLRDGEDSPAYRVAMQVVDDLLWTLDGGGRRASRRQLAVRIPPLLKLLTQGIRDIGARPDDYRAFLDELFVIHLRRMQRDPRDAASEAAESTRPRRADDGGSPDDPATEPPVLQERIAEPPPAPQPPPAERDAQAAPEPRGFAGDDGGGTGEQRLLTVLSTVDLNDFPATPERLRLDPDEAIARLRRGDWLELVGRDGLPQEVKVAWINARRTVVLLVRRPDRRTLSLRTAELHQRFAQRRALLIV